MFTKSMVVYVTIIAIIFILFFAFSGNHKCSREGMEAAESPDQTIRDAAAAGVFINAKNANVSDDNGAINISSSQQGTDDSSSQDNSITVTHDLDDKTLDLLERGNNILSRMNTTDVENAMRTQSGRNNDSKMDNYNYFKKANMPLIYYGPNGASAKILTHNNKYAITVTDKNGVTTAFVEKNKNYNNFFVNATPPTDTTSSVSTIPAELSNTSFYDETGNVAKVYRANDGEFVVQVDQKNGVEVIYTPTNIYTFNTTNSKSYDLGKAVNDTTDITTTNDTTDNLKKDIANNSIANGTPSNLIPPGDMNKYILKTEIVPPVCPRCPSICSANVNQQTPPCPSCGNPGSGDSSGHTTTSTPESTPFNKNLISPDNGYTPAANPTDKYSKYRANNQFLPVPVVSSFSGFSM